MDSSNSNDVGYSSPAPQLLPATELMPLPGCKSQFWRYFGFYSHGGQIIEGMKRVVVCKLCLREMAYSGNTSNLSSHLNSRHPREFAAAKALAHVDRSSTRYVSSTNSSSSSQAVNTIQSPTSFQATAVTSANVVNVGENFFKLPMKSVPSPMVKRETVAATEPEVSTNSPSNSLSVASLPSQSPAEEALTTAAIDLLVSPAALLASIPFIDFCQQLDPNFSPPANLSLAILYQRVRDAVFPVEQRQGDEAFFALSIELDHLLHGRHGTATAERVTLHRLDADFNCARLTLHCSLSHLHADPLAWSPHVRALLLDWDLSPTTLFGLVLAGTWVEGADAACLENIRTRLPQPQFLSLETSLARVIAAAVEATNGKEFITSAICAMNADARNEAARHQDNLLPQWCRLCHYLRDGPLASINAGRVLLAFMTPLEAVYQQLRNEERVHLSVVRPLVALMEKQLALAGGPDVDEGQDWEGLRAQWSKALREEFYPGEGYRIATVLDPRFKSLPFVSESERRLFREELKEKAFHEAPKVYPVSSVVCDTDNGVSAAKKARSSTEMLLSELFNSSGASALSQKCSTTVEDKAEREISNYLIEEDLPLDGNPLSWWRIKKEAQTRLPNLEEPVRPILTFLKEYQGWISVARDMA